jgi:POLQ-like helicase
MRPEQRSQTLLGITRSRAKMFEYDVPERYHIKIPQDPARLFTLSIGLLGDLAARSDDALESSETLDALRTSLQFSARFFDAYKEARLNGDLDPYLLLLGAASFYLCDLPGSSVVLGQRVGPKSLDLGGAGLEELLRWLLQGDLARPFEIEAGVFAESIGATSNRLRQYFIDGLGQEELFAQCDLLRRTAYLAGTPRQLLFGDVACSVIKKKFRNSSWQSLPEYSDLTREQWQPALQKSTFIRELWPAQHLLGHSGVLRGKSAVVQMPTSAGKTKATELIIRSAFLAERTSLAVIIAPFRALCHEIKNSLFAAFRNEAVDVQELSDVTQEDFEIEEFLHRRQVLVVTPEKFVYVLRHTPKLADSIGLLIFDEGHQFDSGVRGITYELLLTSLKAMVSSETQKVLISAVISNAPALGAWLNGPDSEVVAGTKLIPTFRTLAFASWTDTLGRLEFVQEGDTEKDEFYVPRVVEQLPLALKKGETADRFFPDREDGKSVALFLGLKLVKNGAVAIFCGVKATAANLCEMAVNAFDRQVDIKTPVSYSDAFEVRRLHYLHVRNLGNDSSATQSAELGIFSHHNNTPHGVRLAVEHAMREGHARFVICTSTLAQGVNLPIRYLLVTSVYQGPERIKVRDFHNLIGRAGRAGMHTEGTILFADPNVYDKRRSRDQSWRWNQVKELLEPANSEPCISSLLSFFDPFRSDNRQAALKLDALGFAKRYIEDPESISTFAQRMAMRHAANGFTRAGMDVQVAWKLDVISAIESFLLSQWDISEVPLAVGDVSTLAEGTLAFSLADADDKPRIIQLFAMLADNVAQRVENVERRKVFGRTLYGVSTSEEIEAWVRANGAALISCSTSIELLELLWSLISEHIANNTFKKCSEPAALKAAAISWVGGEPFDSLLQVLKRHGARLIWGKKFRQFSVEHAVDICENAIAYDGALLVGAVTELADYTEIEPSGDLTMKLQALQKCLKYGLSTNAAVAVYELGFADRAVALDLCSALDLSNEDRRACLQAIRGRVDDVRAVLVLYPAYFSHILADLL